MVLRGVGTVNVEDIYVERIDGSARYKQTLNGASGEMNLPEADLIAGDIPDDRTSQALHVDLLDGYPEGFRYAKAPPQLPVAAVRYGVVYTKGAEEGSFVKAYSPMTTADPGRDIRLDCLDTSLLSHEQLVRLMEADDSTLPEALSSLFSPRRANRRTIYRATRLPEWQRVVFETPEKPTSPISSVWEWSRVGGSDEALPFDKPSLSVEDPSFRWAWTASQTPDIRVTYEDGQTGSLINAQGTRVIKEISGVYSERFIPTRVPNVPVDQQKGETQVLRVFFDNDGRMRSEPGTLDDLASTERPTVPMTLEDDREAKRRLTLELNGINSTRNAEKIRLEAELHTRIEADLQTKSESEYALSCLRTDLEDEFNAIQLKHSTSTSTNRALVDMRKTLETKRAEVHKLRRFTSLIDEATAQITSLVGRITELQARRHLTQAQARELAAARSHLATVRATKLNYEARFTRGPNTAALLQSEIDQLDAEIKQEEARLRALPVESTELVTRLETSIREAETQISTLNQRISLRRQEHENSLAQLDRETEGRKTSLLSQINELDSRINGALRDIELVMRLQERYGKLLSSTTYRPSYHKLYVPSPAGDSYEWTLGFIPGWSPNATMNNLIRRFIYDYLRLNPPRVTRASSVVNIPPPPPPPTEVPEYPRPARPTNPTTLLLYKEQREAWRTALGVKEEFPKLPEETEEAWALREFDVLSQRADVVRWKKTRAYRRRLLGISRNDKTTIESRRRGESDYDWLKRENEELTRREQVARWKKLRDDRRSALGISEDSTLIPGQGEGELEFDWLKREDGELTRMETVMRSLAARRAGRREALGIAEDSSLIAPKSNDESTFDWLKRENVELERLEGEVEKLRTERVSRRAALGLASGDATTIPQKQPGETDLVWLRRESVELDRMDQEVNELKAQRTPRRQALGITGTDKTTIPPKRAGETVLQHLQRESLELTRLEAEVQNFRAVRVERRAVHGLPESDKTTIESRRKGESIHAWLKRESLELTRLDTELQALRDRRNNRRAEMGVGPNDPSVGAVRREGEKEADYLVRDIAELDRRDALSLQLSRTREARRAALGIPEGDTSLIPGQYPAEPWFEYLEREDRELKKLEAARATPAA